MATQPQRIKKKDQILHQLFKDETIVIASTSGSRCIGNAKDVFNSYISSEFSARGLNLCGSSTEDTVVSIYELIQDATFAIMIASLGVLDLHKLCFSQDQIVEFCRNHSKRLRSDGYATIFLFKEHGSFFVASVAVYHEGLDVHVRLFESNDEWGSALRPRVVVPKLAV